MPVLRSKDPEGVAQEMWALFAVYQATAQLIGAGVDATGIPPDTISFPHAFAAATGTVGAFPPGEHDLALPRLLGITCRRWPRWQEMTRPATFTAWSAKRS
jgi:hypothetical protein